MLYLTNFSTVYALNYNDVYIEYTVFNRFADIMKNELNNQTLPPMRMKRFNDLNLRSADIIVAIEHGANISLNRCTGFALTAIYVITSADCIANTYFENDNYSEIIKVNPTIIKSISITFPMPKMTGQSSFVIEEQINDYRKKVLDKNLRQKLLDSSIPIPKNLYYQNNFNEILKFNWYGDNHYFDRVSYPINIEEIFLPKIRNGVTTDIAIIKLSTPILVIDNHKVYLEQEPIAETDRNKNNVVILDSPQRFLNDREASPFVTGFGFDSRVQEMVVGTGLKILDFSPDVGENFIFNFFSTPTSLKYIFQGYGSSAGDNGGALISYKNQSLLTDYRDVNRTMYFGGIVHPNENPLYPGNKKFYQPYQGYQAKIYTMVFVRANQLTPWIRNVVEGNYASSSICNFRYSDAATGAICWSPFNPN